MENENKEIIQQEDQIEKTENSEELDELAALRKENQELKAIIAGETKEDEMIKEFFEEFPIAEQFADQLNDIATEKQLNDKNGLIYALAVVLSNNFKTPEKLAGDEDFLKMNIYTNEDIKNHFIKEYLENLAKSPIGCPKKGNIPVSAEKKPKTIASAGEMARALFRK